jgi:hypothetical protein
MAAAKQKSPLVRGNAVQLRAERHFVFEAGRGCKQRVEMLTFQRDALQPTLPI